MKELYHLAKQFGVQLRLAQPIEPASLQVTINNLPAHLANL